MATCVDDAVLIVDRLEVTSRECDVTAGQGEGVAVVVEEHVLGSTQPDPVADFLHGLLVALSATITVRELHCPGERCRISRGQRSTLVSEDSFGGGEEASEIHAVTAVTRVERDDGAVEGRVPCAIRSSVGYREPRAGARVDLA